MHKPSKYFIETRKPIHTFWSSLALLVARLEFKIKGVVNKKAQGKACRELFKQSDNIIIP
jgi:hypothetical protein